MEKMDKIIPKNIRDIIYLTQKYNLLNSEKVEEIRSSSKSSLKALSNKYNVGESDMEELWKLLKELKGNNIKILPQYQSTQEFEMVLNGKLTVSDLTIDLSTSSGRNMVAKMYMPMVHKIVNQYVKNSNLSRQELISAALQGLTDAMNEWKRDPKKGEAHVSFKTFAAYRIQQQILNDINKLSHSLSGVNWYAVKNGATVDAMSIDGMTGNDGDWDTEKMSFLGIEDSTNNTSKELEDKNWNLIYKLIENQFKQRDVDIFYRYFGLHGYKREKSKDIAKSMGMSEGNIRNSIINKIISFLKKDRKAIEILSDIQDAYNESLMIEMFGMDKEVILEMLINDDIFILLEELNRWNNKNTFLNSFNSALSYLDPNQIETLTLLLNGNFEILDNSFKKNKKLIILFLNYMYPTESMSRKTDVSLLEYMIEMQEAYKKYYKV
jgi:RNA polymerase sigma factor (sigma-70 family)